MFFLGISAHLFIYLLVPAFLMVCFYFRGVTGQSETVSMFPEAVVCEHTVRRDSEKTYVYQTGKQQSVSLEKLLPISVSSAPLPLDCLSTIYFQPDLKSRTLRAPPCMLN